eukprot:s961_g9.t1
MWWSTTSVLGASVGLTPHGTGCPMEEKRNERCGLHELLSPQQRVPTEFECHLGRSLAWRLKEGNDFIGSRGWLDASDDDHEAPAADPPALPVSARTDKPPRPSTPQTSPAEARLPIRREPSLGRSGSRGSPVKADHRHSVSVPVEKDPRVTRTGSGALIVAEGLPVLTSLDRDPAGTLHHLVRAWGVLQAQGGGLCVGKYQLGRTIGQGQVTAPLRALSRRQPHRKIQSRCGCSMTEEVHATKMPLPQLPGLTCEEAEACCFHRGLFFLASGCAAL